MKKLISLIVVLLTLVTSAKAVVLATWPGPYVVASFSGNWVGITGMGFNPSASSSPVVVNYSTTLVANATPLRNSDYRIKVTVFDYGTNSTYATAYGTPGTSQSITVVVPLNRPYNITIWASSLQPPPSAYPNNGYWKLSMSNIVINQ